MHKNILLLNPPGNKLYLRDYFSSLVSKGSYYWAPIDLLVLSGILGSKYNVRVLDAIVTKMKKEEALKKILNMDIDTIIFLTGAVSWIDDLDFIEEIRRQKDVTTIAIGDIMLYHGLQILEEKPFLDAVLLNFITFDIVDFLEHSSESKKINNLIYKNNGKIITGDKYLDEGTFKIPIPLHHLFP